MPTAAGIRLPVFVGEKGTHWSKIHVHGTPGHGSQPFRTVNALVTAAEFIRRLAAYQPPAHVHEIWRQTIEGMCLYPELTAALLSPERIVDEIAPLPSRPSTSYPHR